MSDSLILITYTTRYRRGGRGFERAARTLAARKREEYPEREVRLRAVESKGEFRQSVEKVRSEGKEIDELHFIGHSGVYGIMFGTTDWPEQFSPHEWREMSIPFAENAGAWFHACRTARWFAPFFARTFRVPTWGYHWYTSFSRSPERFRWERNVAAGDGPLYVVSVAGRKSHGLLGAIGKYSGVRTIEPMIECRPEKAGPEGYDQVADLYDDAFADIRVREDEWRWVLDHLPQEGLLRVLDIGCGNGALLSALSDRITYGLGIDTSSGMIERAEERYGEIDNLDFRRVDSPIIPAEEDTFNLVISFMSFRYLDWDPIMQEIMRVLRPSGKLLIVDMAAAPLRLRDLPSLCRSKLRHRRGLRRNPGFHRKLTRLVNTSEWEQMLRYNPIRAEHEYRWYLASRFPEGTMSRLNVSMTSRLLAFDSGPVTRARLIAQSYP